MDPDRLRSRGSPLVDEACDRLHLADETLYARALDPRGVRRRLRLNRRRVSTLTTTGTVRPTPLRPWTLEVPPPVVPHRSPPVVPRLPRPPVVHLWSPVLPRTEGLTGGSGTRADHDRAHVLVDSSETLLLVRDRCVWALADRVVLRPEYLDALRNLARHLRCALRVLELSALVLADLLRDHSWGLNKKEDEEKGGGGTLGRGEAEEGRGGEQEGREAGGEGAGGGEEEKKGGRRRRRGGEHEGRGRRRRRRGRGEEERGGRRGQEKRTGEGGVRGRRVVGGGGGTGRG